MRISGPRYCQWRARWPNGNPERAFAFKVGLKAHTWFNAPSTHGNAITISEPASTNRNDSTGTRARQYDNYWEGDLGVFAGPSNQYQPVPPDHLNSLKDVTVVNNPGDGSGNNLWNLRPSKRATGPGDFPMIESVNIYSHGGKTTICGVPVALFKPPPSQRAQRHHRRCRGAHGGGDRAHGARDAQQTQVGRSIPCACAHGARDAQQTQVRRRTQASATPAATSPKPRSAALNSARCSRTRKCSFRRRSTTSIAKSNCRKDPMGDS